MRVIVFVKATKDSESGLKNDADTKKIFEEMGKFNQQLFAAGVLKSGDGLKPSSHGKRIAMEGDRRTVIDGPFAPPNELVAGFWIWEVKDMDDAVEWAKKCPNTMPGPSELEIRPFYELSDLAAFMRP